MKNLIIAILLLAFILSTACVSKKIVKSIQAEPVETYNCTKTVAPELDSSQYVFEPILIGDSTECKIRWGKKGGKQYVSKAEFDVYMAHIYKHPYFATDYAIVLDLSAGQNSRTTSFLFYNGMELTIPNAKYYNDSLIVYPVLKDDVYFCVLNYLTNEKIMVLIPIELEGVVIDYKVDFCQIDHVFYLSIAEWKRIREGLRGADEKTKKIFKFSI